MMFHGIYGRMYSLFLFTSLLSFLALLAALDAWRAAPVRALGSRAAPDAREPSVRGARRRRARALRPAPPPASAGSNRDAGRCGRRWDPLLVGRPRAARPLRRRRRRRRAATGFADVRAALLLVGRRRLQRRPSRLVDARAPACAGRRDLALAAPARQHLALFACVIAVPAVAFMLATLNSTASPEARHLIFALPFFSVLLAAPIVELGRRGGRLAPAARAHRRRRAADRRGALDAPEDAAALRRRPAGRGAGARCGRGLARGHVSAERRPARLRARVSPGVGAQPFVLGPHAPASGSGPARVVPEGHSGAARPRSLGLRRERHDEREGATDDSARDSRAHIRHSRRAPTARSW